MQTFDFNIQSDVNMEMSTGGNVGGVTNYNLLDNKPQINGVPLQGNKSGSDLGLDDYTDLINKPSINGVALSGNKTSDALLIPGRIVAGQTYTIDGVTRTAYDGAEVFGHVQANVAVGFYAHAEGLNTKAIGNFTHAEGYNAKATGNYAHVEGYGTTASGDYSHAEGWNCTASGDRSHAEGYETTASGNISHAEGQNTTASGGCSHATGAYTTASGDFSHASGANTTASGDYSFAHGDDCEAKKNYSSAVGKGLVANQVCQAVFGRYNAIDTENKFVAVFGNGEAHTYPQPATRSNALAIGWDGKIYTGNNSQGINLETFYSAYLLTVAALSAVSDKAEENRDELAELVDAGAKNLLNPAAAVGYVGQSAFPISKSGITYTLDANSETITLSDTASSVSTLRIPITLKAGTYHVSGVPSGGSDSSYRADLRTAGGNTFITSDYDYGAGFEFTLSETTAIDYCIRVANGYSPQNVVVSPMICTKAAWDISHTYQPYRPRYSELYARIKALESTVNTNANRAVEVTRSTRTIEDI